MCNTVYIQYNDIIWRLITIFKISITGAPRRRGQLVNNPYYHLLKRGFNKQFKMGRDLQRPFTGLTMYCCFQYYTRDFFWDPSCISFFFYYFTKV
jgi:hypothetical protein